MSTLTLHNLIARQLPAREAVSLTRQRQKGMHEQKLANAAAPHVEGMIAEIEQAAERGCGRCNYSVETAGDTDNETLAFACDYLRSEGYKIEINAEGGSCGESKTVVVVRWLD